MGEVRKDNALLNFSIAMTGICYLFTPRVVHAFVTDETDFSYGIQSSRILLCTSFLFGLFYVLCNTLQAMGAATSALIVNLSRQVLIFIPVIFIMQKLLGVTGLVWAQPIADVLPLILVAVLYLPDPDGAFLILSPVFPLYLTTIPFLSSEKKDIVVIQPWCSA